MGQADRPDRLRVLHRLFRRSSPERKRLAGEIEVMRSELLVLETTGQNKHTQQARGLLELAEVEALDGDLDKGWKYLQAARRAVLPCRTEEALAASRLALARETKETLRNWRM